MSKKKKRKNRFVNSFEAGAFDQHEYSTLNKFQKEVCYKRCKFCSGANPTICYREYVEDQNHFLSDILPSLTDLNSWIQNGEDSILINNAQFILTAAFCEAPCVEYMNKTKCPLIKECTSELEEQFSGKATHKSGKNKKDHNKVVYVKRKPCPTFFCKEGFEAKIEEILNGSNPGKQDKIDFTTRISEEFPHGFA